LDITGEGAGVGRIGSDLTNTGTVGVKGVLEGRRGTCVKDPEEYRGGLSDK
jgi:hypothetical protein